MQEYLWVKNKLDSPGARCHDGFPKTLGLWDVMNNFNAYAFLDRFGRLQRLDAALGSAQANSHRNELDQDLEEFIRVLALMKEVCAGNDMLESVRLMERIDRHLTNHTHDASSIRTQVRHVIDAVAEETNKKRFLYIRSEYGHFLSGNIFDAKTRVMFSNAVGDMEEAGNCLAVECSTAAVFHLMRVAEHGVRKLARSRKIGVKFVHSRKKQPLDHACWGDVVGAIKGKISQIKKNDAITGNKEQQQIMFYSNAADHCTYMKDIFRNQVNHLGKPYSQAEAVAIFGRVRDFMTFLAESR
jgi:hypothetical protein